MSTEKFTLANRNHLSVFLAILAGTGAMCPKCGYGTRKTSKNWAKCKKCGTRVARKTAEEAGRELEEAMEAPTTNAERIGRSLV